MKPQTLAAFQNMASDAIGEGFMLLDRDGRIVAMNREFEQQCAHPRCDRIGDIVWNCLQADDPMAAPLRQALERREAVEFETHDASCGRWRRIRVSPAEGAGVVVLCRDTTPDKRAEALQQAQTRVLELMAEGAPLTAVLDTLLGAVERQSRAGMLGSILLLDADGQHLRHASAPSLPEAYCDAIDGVAVGPTVGSCGAAAYLGEPVYVSDIADSSNWLPFRELALGHGLRACWSTPILAPDGGVLGTFAMYYREARDAPDDDLMLVSMVTRNAAIAIRRQHTEDALRESEQHFRLLFEQAPDGVFVTDAQGRYTDANTAGCELVGYTREQLLQHTIVDLVMPHEVARIPEEVARLAGGAVATSEWCFRRKDGSSFIGELVGRELPDGRLQAFVRDITQRKAFTEALRQSEERFRDLADNIPQLAWIADAGTDGHVHWFNRNWYAYTGTTLEQMRGTGWHAVQHPDHAERVIAKFAEHVREGKDWEDTFPLRAHDGSYRWFLSRMKVIRDDSGAVVRIFGTNTDVTEQRRLEEELRRLAAELSDADQRKNEFLAMLAHELRNPLAPIRNAAFLLRQKHDDAAAVRTASGMIERQVGQLVRLVDDLLDVSRITRGRIELRREKVLLSSVLHDALEATRALHEGMGHQLSVRQPDTPVWLHADPTRLAQVVGNLLNNACKFTDRGGQIVLDVQAGDGEAVIRVRDNGVGIAAGELARIFEMFVQVDTSLERSVSGLGIGLTLVKRLVELHGGTVDAHSDGPGRGSTFTVRLATADADTSHVADKPAPAAAPAPHHILIIDDNRDSANSLAELLRLQGHVVDAAFDGMAGLDAVKRLSPDVVLLDIGLPGLNGYEVARRLRSMVLTPRPRVFALTGWGQEDARNRTREAGFDGHFVKPLNVQVLSDVLAGRPLPAEAVAAAGTVPATG